MHVSDESVWVNRANKFLNEGVVVGNTQREELLSLIHI